MEYNITPIETQYNGRFFRSRLEATWAAFFDLCNWQWEYEPFDLNGWIPDFIIRDKQFGDGELLVEVKPFFLSELDSQDVDDIYKKISSAHEGESLLLGVSPYEVNWWCAIGKLMSPLTDQNWGNDIDNAVINYQTKVVGNVSHKYKWAKIPNRYDISASDGSYGFRFAQTGDGDHHLSPVDFDDVQRMFGMAKRAVRYK
jgi:hypothetical protein